MFYSTNTSFFQTRRAVYFYNFLKRIFYATRYITEAIRKYAVCKTWSTTRSTVLLNNSHVRIHCSFETFRVNWSVQERLQTTSALHVVIVFTYTLNCLLQAFTNASMAFRQERQGPPQPTPPSPKIKAGISFAKCKLPVSQLTLLSFVRM